MLTDQDKARILEEETYRREIRRGLEMADSRRAKRQKLWSIVNSAVFIWFLSSIVLGTGSFLYNRWYVIERENQRTANRLDAEITSRLVYFDHLLVMRRIALDERRTIGERTEIGKRTNDYDTCKLVVTLERPSAVDYPVNVFPEYLNRSLRSLLWELIQVVPEHEKEDIRRAYQKSLQLQVIYLKDLYGNRRPPTGGMINAFQARALSDSAIATREFYSVFNLERWGSAFEELLRKDRENEVAAERPKSE